MCGIVGYVGGDNAQEIIIDGLKKLEYRGYDSAGIAVIGKDGLKVKKHVGRLSNLEKLLEKEPLKGKIGMGHTRWATHGAPSDINAHPHQSSDGKIAIIHNGIIENYAELRDWLSESFGIKFKSETDSEVIAQLISVYYDGDLTDAVFKTVEKIKGAYSILAMAESEPDKIVAVRKDAPLIAGVGKGANFLASDIPALLKYVREIYIIENNETVVVSKDDIKIFNEKRKPVKREVLHVTWDVDAAEKEGYEHFMLKEIYEQPRAIADTLSRRIDEDGNVKIDGIELSREQIAGFNRIYIVACGTAYHAGLIGKTITEKLTGIPVEVDIASEFRYRDPLIDEKSLFIAISQSGETMDTLAALREAKDKGARVLSIVNVVGSSVARESDDVFYTWAGPEIAVASTKAYTTQLICLYLLALYMAREKGSIKEEDYRKYIEGLKKMPELIAEILLPENVEKIREIAAGISKRRSIFYIGRGMDAAVAYEGSLKLKEISYINSFAIAAGELKHGTIALLDEDSIVIALAVQDALIGKMISNIQEVKARGAQVIALTKEGNGEAERQADYLMTIPPCADELAPTAEIVPLQLLAYFIAKQRGCDIDKPKNLAKSVVVE